MKNPVKPSTRRWVRRLGQACLMLILSLTSLWSAAALYVDCPLPWLRVPAAITVGLLLFGLLLAGVKFKFAWTLCSGGFLIVLAWWLLLTPSNDRPWQPDVTQTPWAEIDGDRVTIHNVRNCDYRTETDYTPRWETRSVNLADLRGIDIFITYWGSPWIAHPILSFQFGDNDHLAFSIEVRKEIGEGYSATRGFFRQFELIYIIADERDVVRLRTNYRQGEDSYLFRTRVQPDRARAIFLSYLERANSLHKQPEWYNALTSNCTTNIRVHTAATAHGASAPWDWRILANGKSDEMLYERNALAGDLPLAELRQRAHINPAARQADAAPDFSRRIRAGRPGF